MTIKALKPPASKATKLVNIVRAHHKAPLDQAVYVSLSRRKRSKPHIIMFPYDAGYVATCCKHRKLGSNVKKTNKDFRLKIFDSDFSISKKKLEKSFARISVSLEVSFRSHKSHRPCAINYLSNYVISAAKSHKRLILMN